MSQSFNKSTNAAATQCSTNEELQILKLILVLSIDAHYVTYVTYFDIRTVVLIELVPAEIL